MTPGNIEMRALTVRSNTAELEMVATLTVLGLVKNPEAFIRLPPQNLTELGDFLEFIVNESAASLSQLTHKANNMADKLVNPRVRGIHEALANWSVAESDYLGIQTLLILPSKQEVGIVHTTGINGGIVTFTKSPLSSKRTPETNTLLACVPEPYNQSSRAAYTYGEYLRDKYLTHNTVTRLAGCLTDTYRIEHQPNLDLPKQEAWAIQQVYRNVPNAQPRVFFRGQYVLAGNQTIPFADVIDMAGARTKDPRIPYDLSRQLNKGALAAVIKFQEILGGFAVLQSGRCSDGSRLKNSRSQLVKELRKLIDPNDGMFGELLRLGIPYYLTGLMCNAIQTTLIQTIYSNYPEMVEDEIGTNLQNGLLGSY